MEFTSEERAAQLRKPTGENAVAIMEYMNKGNRILYQHCMQLLPLKENNYVLEIGQGNAYLLQDILNAAPGITYQGLDFSADSIRLAMEYNAAVLPSPNVAFAEGLIGNMPFNSNNFDIVLGLNTIYFWENPEIELAEIWRVLKPGGTAVFGYRPKDFMVQLPFVQHGFTMYNPTDLEALLNKTGFIHFNSHRFKDESRLVEGKEIPMECALTLAVK